MSGFRVKVGVPIATDFTLNPEGGTALIVSLDTGFAYSLKTNGDVYQIGGAGGGDMFKSENLSGLANYTTARSNMGLGTAAVTNSTAYATAAQGTTADSALQPAGNGGSLTGLTKTQVGLANVDNTSDAAKPVSTATQTALNLKAPLANPTFTGTVAGVTAAMVGAPSGSGTSSGTNTGDQTSIVGITGTIAQFNTACTDADFATQAGLDTKQDTLVSGTNIKTVNGSTVLGSGDLVVTGAAPAFNAFTKDLGTARRSGTFDITGLSGLTAEKVVSVVQTAAPIATKGNARDEAEFDQIEATGYVASATTIRAYWQSRGVVVGTYAFAYQVSG